MSKRAVVGLGRAAALLLWAAAVAMPALSAEEPVTIKLWDQHVHDKKFRQSIFKAFNKENPDIKVEYTSQVGGTYSTVVDASFRSGTPPDIFVTTGLPASLAKMVEMGWVIALDELAPSREEFQKWAAKFPPGKLPFLDNVNVFNGKTYSWPGTGDQARMMLYWNTKLFKEAGLKGTTGDSVVPETWEEMRQFAKKITELGQGKVYGIVHGIKSREVWDMDLFSSIAISAGCIDFGGLNFKTGKWDDYDKPEFRRAVQLWLDMKKDGSIFPGDLSMDDEQAKFRFAQDLAGMIFGGYWVPGGLIAVNESLEFDAVLPPTEVRGERKSYADSTPSATTREYVVSSKIKSKEAVWKVVQFMTSQRYQEEWVKAGGGISVFPEYNKPEFFPHPTIAKVAQMGSEGKRTPPPYPEGYLKVYEFFDPGQPDRINVMQGIWIGQLGMDAWDEYGKRRTAAWYKAIDEARKTGVNISREDFAFPDYDPTKDYVPKAKK